jgi:hypothetical protein
MLMCLTDAYVKHSKSEDEIPHKMLEMADMLERYSRVLRGTAMAIHKRSKAA